MLPRDSMPKPRDQEIPFVTEKERERYLALTSFHLATFLRFWISVVLMAFAVYLLVFMPIANRAFRSFLSFANDRAPLEQIIIVSRDTTAPFVRTFWDSFILTADQEREIRYAQGEKLSFILAHSITPWMGFSEQAPADKFLLWVQAGYYDAPSIKKIEIARDSAKKRADGVPSVAMDTSALGKLSYRQALLYLHTKIDALDHLADSLSAVAAPSLLLQEKQRYRDSLEYCTQHKAPAYQAQLLSEKLDPQRYQIRPLLALGCLAVFFGILLALFADALFLRKGYVGRKIEREIIATINTLRRLLSHHAGTTPETDMYAVILDMKTEELHRLAEQYRLPFEDILSLRSAILWLSPHNRLSYWSRVRKFGAAVRFYMHAYFSNNYTNNVLGLVYIGASILLLIIGLRGLKFIPAENPTGILFGLSMEFSLLSGYAILTMFTKEDTNGTIQSNSQEYMFNNQEQYFSAPAHQASGSEYQHLWDSLSLFLHRSLETNVPSTSEQGETTMTSTTPSATPSAEKGRA